jgi:hypothetical protein
MENRRQHADLSGLQYIVTEVGREVTESLKEILVSTVSEAIKPAIWG